MIRRLTFWGIYDVCRLSQASFPILRTMSTTTTENNDRWSNVYQQEVPRTMEEMGDLLGQEVVSPPDARLLKVAIVGVPNCGKSTLINKLMGWRVCSVSSKVHTTQLSARAVYNTGSTQLVFLDTPGLVTPQEIVNSSPRHRLQRTLLTEAELSLQSVDMVAVVHDVSNHFTRSSLHPRVLRLLTLNPTIPAVLILNKVDLARTKRNLLEITRMITEGVVGGRRSHIETSKPDVRKEALIRRALLQEKISAPDEHSLKHSSLNTNKDKIERATSLIQSHDTGQNRDSLLSSSYDIGQLTEEDILAGKVHLTEHQVQTFIQNRKSWPLFSEVFMVSALHGIGVDDLRDFLVSCAPPSPWIFSPQVATDQNPEEIVLTTVRERFLEHFPKEIPYSLRFEVEHWDLTETDLLNIVVKVRCWRRGLVKVVVGGSGSMVSRIGKEVEQALRNTFRAEVRLRLNVVYDHSLKKVATKK